MDQVLGRDQTQALVPLPLPRQASWHLIQELERRRRAAWASSFLSVLRTAASDLGLHPFQSATGHLPLSISKAPRAQPIQNETPLLARPHTSSCFPLPSLSHLNGWHPSHQLVKPRTWESSPFLCSITSPHLVFSQLLNPTDSVS